MEDEKFFTDGMDAIDGDTIMVGSEIVQIEKIENNILYLDREISWAKGDGVVWCQNRKCPDDGLVDIGASQYQK